MKKILDDYFDYFIDKDTISQHIKSGQGSQLYTVEGTLMDAVCFENKVRYEWLKK